MKRNPEQWRAIADYPGYEVSDLGRVKKTKWVDKSYRHRSEKFLATNKHYAGTGHSYVRMTNEHGSRYVKIAELIALAFIPGFDPRFNSIRHRGDNKKNYSLADIEVISNFTLAIERSTARKLAEIEALSA